jgi:hypothetical protein
MGEFDFVNEGIINKTCGVSKIDSESLLFCSVSDLPGHDRINGICR